MRSWLGLKRYVRSCSIGMLALFLGSTGLAVSVSVVLSAQPAAAAVARRKIRLLPSESQRLVLGVNPSNCELDQDGPPNFAGGGPRKCRPEDHSLFV